MARLAEARKRREELAADEPPKDEAVPEKKEDKKEDKKEAPASDDDDLKLDVRFPFILSDSFLGAHGEADEAGSTQRGTQVHETIHAGTEKRTRRPPPRGHLRRPSFLGGLLFIL